MTVGCGATFGANIPGNCSLAGPLAPAGGCGRDPYEVVVSKSTFVDQQTLKLQEAPESVPAGEMPRSLVLIVERAGVQQIAPGTRVTVTGIHSTFSMAASVVGDVPLVNFGNSDFHNGVRWWESVLHLDMPYAHSELWKQLLEQSESSS